MKSVGTMTCKGTDRQAQVRAWRARRAGLVGCLAVGLLAAVAAGQVGELEIDEAWDPALAVHLPLLNKPDKPVDMVAWTDTDPEPDEPWVYVCGFLSNQYNTKVLAVVRYAAGDPSEADIAIYPSDFATTTYNHVPKAMAVDADGNVFITAEMETENYGTDFITLKFLPSLSGLNPYWGNSGVMTFNNESGDGDDTPTDIQVYGEHGTSSQRIFVTGTSFHANEGKNIVTIAYYGVEDATEGWTDFTADYDHDGGNDYASELTAWQTAAPPPATVGFWPVVSGTVREDGEFDLFAMRLYADIGLDAQRQPVWGTPYDDPYGSNDDCTGLAHNTVVEGVNTAPQTVVICGEVGTAEADDTVYLTLALDLVYGTARWESVGTYGVGRAWQVDTTTEGHDQPVDICYGPGPSTEEWVWVTGQGSDGTTLKNGTIAYTITDTDGDLVAESVFYDPDDEDSDDYAAGLMVFQGNYPPVVFVTGWTESASFLPAYLTIQLAGDPLEAEAFARYYGDGLENKAVACWLDTFTGGLFVTGWSGDSQLGLGWGTTRYNPWAP